MLSVLMVLRDALALDEVKVMKDLSFMIILRGVPLRRSVESDHLRSFSCGGWAEWSRLRHHGEGHFLGRSSIVNTKTEAANFCRLTPLPFLHANAYVDSFLKVKISICMYQCPVSRSNTVMLDSGAPEAVRAARD
jgi:hypothetical protein